MSMQVSPKMKTNFNIPVLRKPPKEIYVLKFFDVTKPENCPPKTRFLPLSLSTENLFQINHFIHSLLEKIGICLVVYLTIQITQTK